MPYNVVILIHQDPKKSHRAAEGLRIALGLSTGLNPVMIILLDQAPTLLTDEVEEVIDADILEKHLPVIQELQLQLIVPSDSKSKFTFCPGFSIREASSQDIGSIIASSDRVLVF